MFRTLTAAVALSAALSGAAWAELHEVQMLNRGEDRQTMIFSPSFLRIAPGDTVKFVASDRGHNVESVTELWPEGVDPFAGKINEEIEVTFDQDGLYAVKCKPHFAMGMVMSIAVGDTSEAPDGWLETRLPPKAKTRFEAQLEQLVD